MEISDIDFIPLWEEISEALLRIATNISPAKREEWEKSIYDLLRNPLTPDEERCIKELETWYKQDMDVKDELVDVKDELTKLREELREELRFQRPVVIGQ